ncbi:hypothetical protein [Halococcus thailandensis]|jgi:hypothetical protein|uniref:Uncharacterized protein n=1 Tax=Halococcus thailandensis JCM 13552 TaxID=1227457 RepID=M0NF83_9EURY|nr:hypothetical protein [Halococcus thailandensis]EMA56627.1 hypothetical protein C451_01343 [Halococcus thailandensis JCM 13552]
MSNSIESQRQLSAGADETIAPTVMANHEVADLDFQSALDALREDIDGYGDRIHASAAVLRATDDLDIETNLLTHPRVEQAIWRYEHDPDRVRRQIDLTIEREDAATTVDEVVATFRVAAVRLDTPLKTD